MKKLIALIIMIVLALSITACADDTESTTEDATQTGNADSTESIHPAESIDIVDSDVLLAGINSKAAALRSLSTLFQELGKSIIESSADNLSNFEVEMSRAVAEGESTYYHGKRAELEQHRLALAGDYVTFAEMIDGLYEVVSTTSFAIEIDAYDFETFDQFLTVLQMDAKNFNLAIDLYNASSEIMIELGVIEEVGDDLEKISEEYAELADKWVALVGASNSMLEEIEFFTEEFAKLKQYITEAE